jgi:hypothetical protein
MEVKEPAYQPCQQYQMKSAQFIAIIKTDAHRKFNNLAEVNGLELKSIPRHLKRNKDEC